MLVHGGQPGSVEAHALDWEPTFDKFAQGFHVYAIDKIGQGHTDNPKRDVDYMIGSSVQHLHDFLKALRLPGAHVVGHSRGGYTVCRLALEHPEMVKCVVTVDSGSLMIPRAKFYDDMEPKVALIQDPRERSRQHLALNSFSGAHITEEYLDAIMEISRLPKTQEAVKKMDLKSPLWKQFLKDLDARREETHAWIRKGGLKSPTLIVWAYNDPSATADVVGRAAMNLIFPSNPRTQMHVLNEAGHYCFREQPAAFVGAVTSFIQTS